MSERSPFTIDRTDLDEAGRICTGLVIVSLIGAVLSIGVYFVWRFWI